MDNTLPSKVNLERFEDHHGGGLWLKDHSGWFFVRNLAGIEWSAQFCVASGMRVLTADLRWIPAGEVRAGDQLAGFDESIPASGRRRWRRSVVERAEVITRPCYDVAFEDGSHACATADHLWLASGSAGSRHGTAGWYRTDSLVSSQGWGCRSVLRPVELWAEDKSWEAGYLAAAFDGEGHFIHGTKGSGSGHGGGQQFGIVFSQRDNEMYAEVVRCLKVLGYTFREETRPDVRQVIIARRHEVLRFLGSVRPRRMLARFDFDWLGQLNAMARVRVDDVRYVGERPVAVLTTSTSTYIAEGLAVHNCADPARVDLLRKNAQRLYAGFPGVAEELGITELLNTPIRDATGVARWTDSICNASVPMPAALHTAVLPHGGGVHHYPAPVVEIETFKRDDFTLFVTDSQGHQAAVVPVAPYGSGDGRVQVLWANVGSRVHAEHMTAMTAGRPLILDEEHELAKLAFARQR